MGNKIRFGKTLVGDFETTVFEGQTYTEVWAAAVVEIYTEDVKIFGSLPDLFDYLVSLNTNICIYFHNLKFDGSFWLPFLQNLGLKQAYYSLSDKPYDITFYEPKEMPPNTFKYSISNMGQWYTITIHYRGHFIEIRDSLKLLPFSVKKIGKGFQTKHRKLEMEYEGFRYAGCEITDKEKEYIANDVLVVKEALEIMFREGHKELTIGTCCLKEFRTTFLGGKSAYNGMFPDLTAITLDEDFGAQDADEYVRKAYKGGWCYLVKGKENKIFTNGTTADVNSLYPSMMHSDSGNYFPVGTPKFYSSKQNASRLLDLLDLADKRNDIYYFVRIKCRFKLKDLMLPTIQIKQNPFYRSNEWLESSYVYNFKTGTYSPYIYENGEPVLYTPELTLSKTDFALFKEHYYIYDLEILDACFFDAVIGIFDDYINKYRDIKVKSTGALRELAKLFLNNLYGKFATSKISSFKLFDLDADGVAKYTVIQEFNKKTVYIPIGAAITSYARNFTIRAAQKNFYGVDKSGFIYADTDSIHCDISPDKMQGINVHDVNFCCWKLEAQWDKAIFVRQKTYMEHVIAENLKPIATPYDNIKCAGMPETCKELLRISMLKGGEEKCRLLSQQDSKGETIWEKMSIEERQFITKNRSYADYKKGLKVPSKLLPKQIKGGTILVSTTYEMR